MIMRAEETQYKFVRAKDPNVALLLLPWFIENGTGMERSELGANLYERMDKCPDETFVILIYRGNDLIAFGVAYCRKDDVFIWQAGSIGRDRRLVDVGFDIIKRWARSKGYCNIITQPNRRNFKIWKRRWGFEQINENDMSLRI